MKYLLSLPLLLFFFDAHAEISAGSSKKGSMIGVVHTKEEMQAQKAKEDEQTEAEKNLNILDRGVLRQTFRSSYDRSEVPGYISLRANRSLGIIVGPLSVENASYPINSTVYMRWRGINRPQVGEIYAAYTPAVVLQSRNDFTDFKLRQNRPTAHDELRDYTHAGYLYESNGDIEIIDVSRGIVKGRVVNNYNRISVNDHIMAVPPKITSLQPIESPIRMTAAIVAGSPSEKLAPSTGSYIYLNRGRRDGVKVGTVFQTLEPVHLSDGPIIRASGELGEATVIYASDAYSTAVITKQFNLIRIGSLLETARPGGDRAHQFNMLNSKRGQIEEPTDGEKYISELDKIEKDSDILSLSPEERERLERLQQQELKKRQSGVFPQAGESQALPAPSIEEGGTPKLPEAPNITVARKQREEARKRRLKQRKEDLRKRDEEKLNSLFNE